jgi:hypothetical protein
LLVETVAMRFAELPDTEQSSVSERRILSVVLPKDGPGGIGITLVGGNHISPLDLGCFVESIIPGSPADQDGRIQPGDRIIAINGKSVEGLPHHRVVALIRDSHQHVALLVSQPLNPMEVPDLLSRDSSPSPNRLDAENIIIDPPEDVTRTTIRPPPDIPMSVNSSDLDLEDMLPPNFDLSAAEGSDRSNTPIQQAIEEGRQSVIGRGNPPLDPGKFGF